MQQLSLRQIAEDCGSRNVGERQVDQDRSEAEQDGLNCKCADVFIAGPETNERPRDGPASLCELIEVAANGAPAV